MLSTPFSGECPAPSMFSRSEWHGSGSHISTGTAQHLQDAQLQCHTWKGMLQGHAFRHILVSEDDACVHP